MTPSHLADRIAALDWSGVSLQHRLAVTAACETLRNSSAAEVERAATEVPAQANVIAFRLPSVELLRGAEYTPGKRITLLQLDGTPVASALLARSERWDWIVETTCSLLSCSPDSVHMVDDTVTVRGEAVFNC